jgi:hypothetical protein
MVRVVGSLDQRHNPSRAGPFGIAWRATRGRRGRTSIIAATVRQDHSLAKGWMYDGVATRLLHAAVERRRFGFAPARVNRCAWTVVGQFGPGGRGVPRRAVRAMRSEKKRRNATTTRVPMLRTAADSFRPRTTSTKAPARSHNGRLASQRTRRFSHGSRLPDNGDDLAIVVSAICREPLTLRYFLGRARTPKRSGVHQGVRIRKTLTP